MRGTSFQKVRRTEQATHLLGSKTCCHRLAREGGRGRPLADEICLIIDASRAFIFGRLRIGTERPGAIGFAAGAMRSDHADRRLALLLPLLERAHHIEGVGAFLAAAMTHPGDHEEPNGISGLGLAAQGVDNTLVVMDGRLGRNVGIAEALVEQQSSVVGEKWFQIVSDRDRWR